MTDDPKPESPKDDAEFQRVLENLVNTSHTPHKPRDDFPAPTTGGSGEKRNPCSEPRRRHTFYPEKREVWRVNIEGWCSADHIVWDSADRP
jgi:hypothetical protein